MNFLTLAPQYRRLLRTVVGFLGVFSLMAFGFGLGWYAKDNARHGMAGNGFLLPNPEELSQLWEKSPLFIWQGKKFHKKDLPQEATEKLTTIAKNYAKATYQAHYDLYRESLALVQKQVIAMEVAEKGKSADLAASELERQLLPVDAVSQDDAFKLFKASDPAGTKKEFEQVKNQLLAYIQEVAKREAGDALLASLKEQKRFLFLLAPPQPFSPDFSLSGFPYVGNPDAKFVVVNFTDFMCYKCPDYNVKFAELINKSGFDVKFVFVPFPFARPDRGVGISRGALCAHEQGTYLDYHMKLVSLGEFVKDADPESVAKSAGLEMGAFRKCYSQGTGVAQLLARAEAYAKEFGVLQTPYSYALNRAFAGKEELSALRSEIEKSRH